LPASRLLGVGEELWQGLQVAAKYADKEELGEDEYWEAEVARRRSID